MSTRPPWLFLLEKIPEGAGAGHSENAPDALEERDFADMTGHSAISIWIVKLFARSRRGGRGREMLPHIPLLQEVVECSFIRWIESLNRGLTCSCGIIFLARPVPREDRAQRYFAVTFFVQRRPMQS